MRLSTDKDDPGYSVYASVGDIKVYLNGAQCSGVITADEEKRYALRLRRTDSGMLMFDNDGKLATEQFYGHVRLEISEAARRQIDNERDVVLAPHRPPHYPR